MAASEETKEAVAKVGFMAFMAAAMGPVGIVIAALSVGIDRAISGDGGRQTSEDLSRQQVADHRQWLAEDRAFRERLRAERQKWLNDGGSPESEPHRPSRGETIGRWWRRLWARMVVFSDDFKNGWRDGWHAAKDARNRGADWWETARARPDDPEADDFDWSWADEPETFPQEPTPDRDGRDADDSTADEPQDPPADDRSPNTRFDTQEEPVTAPAKPAPTGPSNVDVLAEKLRHIGRTVDQTDNIVDQLSRLADTLAAQVRAATDHANATGQATATKAALDAASQMVTTLRQLVGNVSDAAAKASDETAAARASLRPVQQAQDDIQAVGATGDAVATAKAG